MDRVTIYSGDVLVISSWGEHIAVMFYMIVVFKEQANKYLVVMLQILVITQSSPSGKPGRVHPVTLPCISPSHTLPPLDPLQVAIVESHPHPCLSIRVECDCKRIFRATGVKTIIWSY